MARPKVLVIRQAAAADENVARRILVGDAGQQVEGVLTKLGLTRSYVMINAILYSLDGAGGDSQGCGNLHVAPHVYRLANHGCYSTRLCAGLAEATSSSDHSG